MHLTNETIEALKAAGGFLAAIVVPLMAVGKVIAKRKATEYAKKWLESQPVDEPPTRKLPTLPEGEDDTPDAQLRFYRDRCAHLLERLAEARYAAEEAAKLSDARERALEAELRDSRSDLKQARSDLAVATSARMVAERAGQEIERQWRRSQGLPSKPPPANPLSSGARTKPPPKG